MRGRQGVLLSAVGVLVTASAVMMISGPLRWRTHVLALYFTGQIADIGLKQLLVYMMPGSGQYLQPLVETHNPYAAIRNVRTSPADLEAGARLFRNQCGECHSPDGSGGRGPSLLGRKDRKSVV